MIDSYDGTVLLVSHDRDFLNRVVNSTIAVEGDGVVEEYPGGYADYLRQRKNKAAKDKPTAARRAANSQNSKAQSAPPKRLTFKEQHELDNLPDRIANLETAKAELEKALADPNLFARDRSAYEGAAEKLAQVEKAISGAEDRWLKLDARQEELQGRATS